jgi:signal transduction histidine kinase
VVKNLYTDVSRTESDLGSYRRQRSAFIILNIAILVIVLGLHESFSSFWGKPTLSLVVAIGCAVILNVAEFAWLMKLQMIPSRVTRVLVSWTAILVNLVLAFLLSHMTDSEDSPYFVLLLVPILEAAFRFHLITVIGIVSASDFLLFLWVWDFFRHHPPVDVGEFFEAGITSLMFIVVGILVWQLVNDLRRKQANLAHYVLELERTREQLLQEEKLAAVGRLSSAIAHEIRNPVAMISSSLATAARLTGAEREEMLSIAAEESARLVALTTDFLAYARPRSPRLEIHSVADTLHYIADACRAHASQKGVQLKAECGQSLMARIDPGQLQQALINLVMNAIDAAPTETAVTLSSFVEESRVLLKVENEGPAIPESTRSRMFEPFFTMKPRGTGLGLAIARNIARAHGGDLFLSENRQDKICFAISLPLPGMEAETEKESHGTYSHR